MSNVHEKSPLRKATELSLVTGLGGTAIVSLFDKQAQNLIHTTTGGQGPFGFVTHLPYATQLLKHLGHDHDALLPHVQALLGENLASTFITNLGVGLEIIIPLFFIKWGAFNGEQQVKRLLRHGA